MTRRNTFASAGVVMSYGIELRRPALPVERVAAAAATIDHGPTCRVGWRVPHDLRGP